MSRARPCDCPTVTFACRTCGTGTAPACAVTLVDDLPARIVAVCGTCGTTLDRLTGTVGGDLDLVRPYVRVVVPARTTADLTPEAVLALANQIRSLPEVTRP